MEKITQKKCLKWAYELPELTEAQKSYCVKRLPAIKFKYRNKEYVTESDKEEVFEYKQRLRNGKGHDIFYYLVITTYKGVQVFRHFWAVKFFDIYGNSNVMFHEVYQNWIKPDGNRIVTGKAKVPMRASDYFMVDSNYGIRKPSVYSYYGYDYASQYVIKTEKFADYVTQKGISCIMKGENAVTYLTDVLQNHIYECLLKMGLLDRSALCAHKNELEKFFRQIVLANRAGYKPKNWQLWLDCISIRKELGYDINSRKYLCIENLEKEHNKLQVKINRIKQAKELKEEVKYNPTMLKNLGKCANICIKKDNIEIRALVNVEQVFDVAQIHKHCVYSQKYYKRPDTILLEAYFNNMPKETIEYNCKTNIVLQSRGTCNQQTEYHDTILEMMSRLKVNNRTKTFKITAS